MIPVGLLWLGAYLSGSIPFGLIIARARGIDIRAHGSGNVGSTNVGRILGRRWGLLVLALDALKGALPLLATSVLLSKGNIDWPDWASGGPNRVRLGTASFSVLGSIFPIFAGFRGGKGVGITLGIVLALPRVYPAGLLAALVWFCVRRLTGYVSLASILAVAVLPLGYTVQISLTSRAWRDEGPILLFLGGVTLMVILRHRENIVRLLRHTETRSSPSGTAESR